VGIGGWLLLFILQLVVLNPGVIGWRVVQEINVLRENGALASPVGLMIGVDSLVRLSLAAFGVVCGALLWVRYLRAVAMVRYFLVLFPLGHLLLVTLPFAFALPTNGRMHIAGIYMYRAGMAVPATIFWFLYFKHSRRVKATYGTKSSAETVA
jgi:hypothetical protein